MTEFISALSRLAFRDVVDVVVVSFLIYHILLLIKGTRGWNMTLGISSLIVFYQLTRYLDLRTIEWLLTNFFTYFIFALVVIFQAEIRRGLAELGRGRFFRRFVGRSSRARLEEIVVAVTTLSSEKIGALIVIEGEIGLRNYVERGIHLDAFLTYDLLVTIFNPKTPLHDGAVVIQGDRVSAAACFLPLTVDPYLSKELGARHRAAIGLTEEADAIAIVVSEETGKISVVVKGKMTRNLDGPRLLKILQTSEKSQEGSLAERGRQSEAI